jgi:hypothetical protein
LVVIWIGGVKVEDGGKGKDDGVGRADGVVIISGEGFEAGAEDRAAVSVERGEFVVGLGDCSVSAGFVFGLVGKGMRAILHPYTCRVRLWVVMREARWGRNIA